MSQRNSIISRRSFLGNASACGAVLMSIAAANPLTSRRLFQESQENEKLFQRDWGWIEKLGDNVWAHIASPFDKGDYTTVCNGGIIAGTERVLVVESFQKPEGAKWVAERCKELTGRWPTDVVVTHFHGDHSSGDSGFRMEGQSPRLWLTPKTEELLGKSAATTEADGSPSLKTRGVLDSHQVTEIDLGGRAVKLIPSSGHTSSDVVIEITDPSIVFTGDLFWNRLVPNFRDAAASRLSVAVESLVREEDTLYVPGHGTMSGNDDLLLFQEFLATMKEVAKKTHTAGKTWEVAASEFSLEGKFKDWYVFADSVMPAIFRAWYREFDQSE